MFNIKKLVREDDLLDYFYNLKDIHNKEIRELNKQIENLKEKISKYNNDIAYYGIELNKQIENLKEKISKYNNDVAYYGIDKSKYLYTINLTKENKCYSFETKEQAIIFFKNEIWQKHAFKANKIMWDAIYEAVKNGDIKVAEEEIDDK